ncbi:MAG: winged helix DNA-binding domain-containing protein [Chthoniobacterales bacterium]
MTPRDIVYCRLANQQIARPKYRTPHEMVASLGAMQAQDYLGALWAIGLRLPNASEADVEQAIANRTIVRSWSLRGTLHFVAAADIRWMLELLAPRVIASGRRRQQELELNDKIIARIRTLFVRALQDGKQLTRDQMYALLESARISSAGQRGYHILWRLAHEGIICCGARKGKQPTFTLVDEWAPNAKSLQRDEALAELTRRYFTGHGPATLQDFVWWSGLKVSDAGAGLDMVASSLIKEMDSKSAYWMSPMTLASFGVPAEAYLLPSFDEYMLGYKDRTAALDRRYAQKIAPENNGRFMSTMIYNGRVVGTWKRGLNQKAVVLTMQPFTVLKKAERQAFAAAAERYAEFIGRPVVVSGWQLAVGG